MGHKTYEEKKRDWIKENFCLNLSASSSVASSTDSNVVVERTDEILSTDLTDRRTISDMGNKIVDAVVSSN